MLEHHSQEFNSLLDSPTWMALDSIIPTHPNLNISEFPQELASHLRRLPFFSLPVSCRIFKKEIDQPLEKWPPGRFWSERRIGLRMQEACRAAGLEPWDPVLETGWVDFERVSDPFTLFTRNNTKNSVFMTKQLTGKPLDFHLTLKYSREGESWRGREAKIRSPALLSLHAGESANWLTGDLAGRGLRQRWGHWGPEAWMATFSKPCLLSLTLRQRMWLYTPIHS